MKEPEVEVHSEPRSGTYLASAVVGLGLAGTCESLASYIHADSQAMDGLYLGGSLVAGTAVLTLAVSTAMAVRGLMIFEKDECNPTITLTKRSDLEEQKPYSAAVASVFAGTFSATVLTDSHAIKDSAPTLSKAGYHAGGLMIFLAGTAAAMAVKRGFS